MTAGDQSPQMAFGDQLARVLEHLESPDAALFLAGVRFVQGSELYGDSLFTMSDEDLERAMLEEQADEIVYSLEISARMESSG